jgi:hypothetical protein
VISGFVKPETKGFTVLLCVSENGTERAKLWTAPIVREWFYELLLIGISIGNRTVDLPCWKFNTNSTVIDSGTTSLVLPTEVRWTGMKIQVDGSGFWDVVLCCLVSGFMGCSAVLFGEWFLTF